MSFFKLNLPNNLFSKFKKKFFLLFFFLLLEAFLVSVSVISIIPLVDFLFDSELKNPSKITNYFLNIFYFYNIHVSFFLFSVIFIFLNIFRSCISLVVYYFILKVKYSIIYDLNFNLLKNIFNAKLLFFNDLGPGRLANTFNKVIYQMGDAILSIINIIVYFLQIVVFLTIPFWINYKFTLIVIFSVLIFSIPFLLLNSITHTYGRKNLESSNKFINFINESIISIRVIIGYGQRDNTFFKGMNYLNSHINYTISSQIINSLISYFFKPISIVSVLVALGLFVGEKNNFSEYTAIFWSLYSILPLISNILISFNNFRNNSPSLDQFNEILKKSSVNYDQTGSKKFTGLKNSINFNKITFNYNDKKNILRDLSFEIKKNSFTSLIGMSGSGKSTVVDLLLGLQRPDKGEILIDALNFTDIDVDSFRNHIGFVSQDTYLFYASLRENLLWVKQNATEYEINESLKLANAYDFVMKLPHKLNTIVGERGTELSGGERQRIALARAFLRKPQLLILDEATSAIDNKTEDLIVQSIIKVKKEFTIFFIAHKSNLISLSDKIYVIENGAIVEEGSYNELSRNINSNYNRIMK